MRFKRVLLLYFEFGEGHKRAAWAIEQRLKRQFPDIAVKGVDPLSKHHDTLMQLGRYSFQFALQLSPKIYGFLHRHAAGSPLTKSWELVHKYTQEAFQKEIQAFQPDLIITTHCTGAALACKLRGNFKVIGVSTDYLIHPYWLRADMDYFCVPHEQLKKDTHLPAERVWVTGIPVDEKYGKQSAGTMIPTFLVSGGSLGTGNLSTIVQVLEDSPHLFQMHVVTGKNEGLYRRLKRKAFTKQVTIHPYMPHLAEVMDKADVLIGKTGGVTSSEALAKGIPIVTFRPYAGQEASNAKFLAKEGVARVIHDTNELNEVIEQYFQHHEVIKGFKENLQTVRKPFAAQAIVQKIAELP